MSIPTKEKAFKILFDNKKLTSKALAQACSISRQYANSVIRQMIKEGRIIKIGSTYSAYYVSPEDAGNMPINIKNNLKNENLEEHKVLNNVEKQFFSFARFSENIKSIFEYAFSEMLNNAIEHSESKSIIVEVKKQDDLISFIVNDSGIGVFKNVMQKRKLKSELEAIQDLLKGKTTTQPKSHSGEGIFFTSKVADVFILESFGYKLRVDNLIKDVFIEETKPSKKGTRVIFLINKNSKKHLNDIFQKYQEGFVDFGFNKTEVKVKLFTMGTIYISRSQARRILAGLGKFKSIILDFDKVSTIGQAFADEIFRVFFLDNPSIKVQAINTNKAVQFMIDRVDRNNINSEEKTAELF